MHPTLRLARLTALLTACLLLTACSNDEQQYSTKAKAYFYFSPTTAATPLHSALRNAGMWCTVERKSGRTYTFVSNDGRNTATATSTPQNGSYDQPFECIAGMVIGTPSVPNLNGQWKPVAYDRACPVCYDSEAQKVHTLRFGKAGSEEATCPFCHTTYDLTNRGISPEGKRLMEYPIEGSEAGGGSVFVHN